MTNSYLSTTAREDTVLQYEQFTFTFTFTHGLIQTTCDYPTEKVVQVSRNETYKR